MCALFIICRFDIVVHYLQSHMMFKCMCVCSYFLFCQDPKGKEKSVETKELNELGADKLFRLNKRTCDKFQLQFELQQLMYFNSSYSL